MPEKIGRQSSFRRAQRLYCPELVLTLPGNGLDDRWHQTRDPGFAPSKPMAEV
jgi:hypothetical protein